METLVVLHAVGHDVFVLKFSGKTLNQFLELFLQIAVGETGLDHLQPLRCLGCRQEVEMGLNALRQSDEIAEGGVFLMTRQGGRHHFVEQPLVDVSHTEFVQRQEFVRAIGRQRELDAGVLVALLQRGLDVEDVVVLGYDEFAFRIFHIHDTSLEILLQELLAILRGRDAGKIGDVQLDFCPSRLVHLFAIANAREGDGE